MNLLKKIFKSITSMKMAITLLMVFAISSAVATFIENDYGTETAKALVYSSLWFELIMLTLGIILLTNIFRFKMYKKNKLTSLLFHAGFILILIGAGMTRFIGFEGIMHIREGTTENRMLSSKAYLQFNVQKGVNSYHSEEKIMISSLGGNDFEQCIDIDGKAFCLKYVNFIKNAQKKLVEDAKGDAAVSIVVTTRSGPKTIMLNDAEVIEMDAAIFSFNGSLDDSKSALNFSVANKQIFISSNRKISWYKMSDQSSGEVKVGTLFPLITKAVYTIGNMRFVPQQATLHGKVKVVPKDDSKSKVTMKSSMNQSALIVEAKYGDITKEVALFGKGMGYKGFEEITQLGALKVTLEWGSKVLKLPFFIKLNDFEMLKYAGSKSPSSYKSNVTLIDKKNGVNMPYSIYMNNTLNYQKYRFFQSSYDMDEAGTILSVSKDPGKIPTYIGYIMLALGLFLNMFNPKSRFRKLASAQKNASLATLLLLSLMLFANPTQAKASEANDIIHTIKSIDKQHAEKFGTIIVQDRDGRMKPINTVGNEVLNKVSRSSTILGLDANQVILGMITKPQAWQKIKMIKLFHPKTKKLLGVEGNKFAFVDAFDYSLSQPYLLFNSVAEANQKKPAKRNQFDKDILKIDERLNILYMVYTSKLLMMFPRSDDVKANKSWLDPQSAVNEKIEKNAEQINIMLGKYLAAVNHGINTDSWEHADSVILEIKAYQNKYGASIMPKANKIKAELLFNKLKIFERLMPIYLILGLILLLLTFVSLVKTNMKFRVIYRVIFTLFIASFITHTLGLGLRWYVSGHAPWSDGYESMIYISWAIMLAGISFSKHSVLALSSTGILTGITLFTAHLSWMDPQITNLVPVLKSYWLTIHVSVITASYGFLALSAIIGFITLIFIILHKQIPNIGSSIKEASRINEMTMIVGLALLTVGNFLGGVWANESWGRYWGWDPKETWALVSILVYASVVHLRFIPKFNNSYAFAVASVLAFSSIIMTYLGVNYYLSGMHSYAAGDPVPIPDFVYYSVAIVSMVVIVSYVKWNGFKKIP